MNRSDAARELKSRYAEYFRPAKKQGTYVCPLCGNGTGKDGDGLSVIPESKGGDGARLHCFRCGFSGDIVDFYRQEHGCSTGEAFRALYDRFGITVDENRPATAAVERRTGARASNTMQRPKKPAERRTEALDEKPDFRAYISACAANIDDPKAQAYLALRGISPQTAQSYYLGYDKKAGFLIIPTSFSFYIARNVDPAAKMRYKNPAGAAVELLNETALYRDDDRPLFIVEGAIDALSIIEAGGEAVALNSTSNVRKLLDMLTHKRTRRTLILCLDHDATGEAAAAQLADGLRGLNIPFTVADICGQHKDPNEALTADRAAFIETVAAAQRSTRAPDNTADYMRQSMAAEIEVLRAQTGRKTGFPNLDAEAGSVYSGLYCVGGISSVGKTTFISQLADQMAAQGQHVLFFSMEQSRLEMVSKSISRLTAKADPDKAVNSLQIRTGADGASIRAAKAEYLQTVGDRVSIIEGNFNCTVSFIGDYTRRYIAQNGGVKPVLFVDYLQVLQADADPQSGRKITDTRQLVDHNVTELKRLSRSLELPIFVISSVNRSNYLTPIDFESFKESGGIEYGADCVWGLQLSAIHDPLFEREKDVVKKRAKIAEAKEAMPREIELVCLKNRYGKSRYSCEFTYYPQYDYFVPKEGGSYKAADFYKSDGVTRI